MSREAVSDSVGKIRWHMPTAEMGINHVPFSELSAADLERDLLRRAVAGEQVLLLGARGAGKTSVLTGALGPLADLPGGLAAIRISVLLASEDTLSEPLEFCRYLLQQVEQWADPTAQLARQDIERLQRATAAREATQSGGFRLNLGLSIPLHMVNAAAAAEISTRARTLHRDLNAPALAAGMRGMLQAFGGQGISPFFVFEDADQWTSLDGDATSSQRVAERFFRLVVQWLAREGNVGFLVSVRDDYTSFGGYQEARSLMSEVRVPRLPAPAHAIGVIIDRRLEQEGVPHRHSDVFTDTAMVALGEVYSEALDMRAALKVASFAVDLTQARSGVMVTDENVRAAERQAAVQ